ncbi:MAG: type IV secretory system conjugative DNA transfer family protein [Clostridiales bacterium]|nr:type IV secretory system conjugative DNA transfer family protein [Clostridiales bacterium]
MPGTKKKRTGEYIFVGILTGIFGGYLGYLVVSAYAPGMSLLDYIQKLNAYFKDPFQNYFTIYSPFGIFFGMFFTEIIVFMYYLSRHNYMTGKEFGTARWEDPGAVNNALADKDYSEKNKELVRVMRKHLLRAPTFDYVNTRNRRISQNIEMTLDTQITDLNNNIFVIGGSGAGKTFRFVQPNLLTMSSSFICTDPKGEIFKKSGGFLKNRGYRVGVLNLLNENGMKKSTHYNPFRYLQSDADVLKLVTNFMQNTTKKDANSGDQFWVEAASALLNSLCFYTWKEGVDINNDGKKDHSFRGVVHLLRKAEFKEDPQTMAKMDSELDIIMNDLEDLERERKEADEAKGIPHPDHPALIYYNQVMRGAADTTRSIIQTLNSRFGSIQNEAILDLLSDDEMDLETIGERKTVIYCVIPDNDKTFNWLVGLLYSQMFQIMYYQADFVYGGSLPVHVTFMLDEFANVALPDDYLSLLSTMRSRNISSIIIVQALAQVKKLFKEGEWENITANCDTTIYLGSNEEAAHKYISEMLGKATIEKASTSQSRGQQSSSTKSDDRVGRELLFENEVRGLSKKKCIIFIRGFDPIVDDKIKTLKLPFWKEYCALQKGFSFDGRIERYERVKGKKSLDGTTRVSTVVMGSEIESLEAKDSHKRQEYDNELTVAKLTESMEPEKPEFALEIVKMEELFNLVEKLSSIDEDTLTSEEVVNEQVRIIQEVVENRLNSPATANEGEDNDEINKTPENSLSNPSEEVQMVDEKNTPNIVNDSSHAPLSYQELYVELITRGYTVDQATEMLVMIDYDSNLTIYSLQAMFPVSMQVGDIRSTIQAFYG